MAAKPSAETVQALCSGLTAFQIDALAAIARMGRPHGLGIKSELEKDRYDDILHGTLYPNLDTLVEKGLVKKGERDARTNWYALTVKGAEQLDLYQQWLSDSLHTDEDDAKELATDGGVDVGSSGRIDHWDCEDCMLSELDGGEKELHAELTDHTIVPRYV